MAKNFTQLYISRYSFIPTNPLLAAMSFFFFFFFQNTVRSFPKRLNTKTKTKKTASNVLLRRTNKQSKKNLRFTNNANKIREISPEKFWLSWTSKELEKSTRLSRTIAENLLLDLVISNLPSANSVFKPESVNLELQCPECELMSSGHKEDDSKQKNHGHNVFKYLQYIFQF